MSDSGEVTALEVLPNDDSTSHKNLHSSHKRYKKSESDNNQIFTSSGQIETFNITNEISSQLISNKEQNNGVATSAGMDINVQQISTFKSDVPYVLSGVEGNELIFTGFKSKVGNLFRKLTLKFICRFYWNSLK